MLWDLFCRVVDNFGDIGVSWRLAADLAARGEHVRLWADDASALAWMAPGGTGGVTVLPFADAIHVAPGDVVVEAFGCDPPPAFLARMAAMRSLWINVEHLSAEPYVERSHGLPSPQSAGPGAGLTRWFFFPGFSERSGGLLRERGIADRSGAFDADAWLAGLGLAARPGERVVSLFCYANPALAGMIELLADQPTLLLATHGIATDQVRSALGPTLTRGALRASALPLLPQAGFDDLLRSSDLNFVRGEDSLVRAVWAGRPFVWQAYAQQDGAHARKVEALLERLLSGAACPLEEAVRALWRGWNGLAAAPTALPPTAAWAEQVLRWRGALLEQTDLTTRLLGFVSGRR